MKSPSEMSAAAINKELDELQTKDSAVLDELIAAGRGHELASETMQKTDPLSLKLRKLRERHSALMFEVRRRAGPGMYRLPKGFGPMKNPARLLTPAAVNKALDKINAKPNPARKTRAVRVVAANPALTFARDKTVKAPDLPYSVQHWNASIGAWSTLAAFGMVDYATKWARQYARDFPAQTVRVVDRF